MLPVLIDGRLLSWLAPCTLIQRAPNCSSVLVFRSLFVCRDRRLRGSGCSVRKTRNVARLWLSGDLADQPLASYSWPLGVPGGHRNPPALLSVTRYLPRVLRHICARHQPHQPQPYSGAVAFSSTSTFLIFSASYLIEPRQPYVTSPNST